MLGLALHPDLLKGAGRDYVYVAYTYDADAGPALSRKLKVRRYTYDPAKSALTNPVDLITNLPAHDDHGGGRLAFGPDQKLYLTRGDNGGNWLANYCTPNRSQDLPTAAQVAARDWSTYVGKILRLNLDGSIPADNPTINGVRSHIYTYGHRNPQGLEFGPTGLLYSSEHGPGTDDELNLIVGGQQLRMAARRGLSRRSRLRVLELVAVERRAVRLAEVRRVRRPVPASVPRQRESEWTGTFVPPMRTFFTVPENYDFQKSGGATIAAGGLDDLYGADERHSGLGEFRAADRHDDGTRVSREVERRRPLGGRDRTRSSSERQTAIETSRSAATSERFIW